MSEPTIQSIQNLLSNVALIKNKYDDIAKITGENFNIFSVFNKTYHENYHSALISELLNEKGSHEQGRLYLDLFIPIVNKRINDKNSGINEIVNFENSTSVMEKPTNDGRIDILLSNNKQAIVIENKIGAKFMPNQLAKYYQHTEKNVKDFLIVYLWKKNVTFEEKEFNIEPYPFGNPDKNIENYIDPNLVKSKTISMSYADDIKTWIEACIKASATLPLIRETLIQYLHTVNTITNQSTNNKMSDEIIKLLLSNDNNIDAAINIKNILNELPHKLAQDLIERFSKDGVIHPFKKRDLIYQGKVLIFDEWLNSKSNYCITIDIDEKKYSLRFFDRNQSTIVEGDIIAIIKNYGFELQDTDYRCSFNVFKDEEKIKDVLKAMFNKFSNLENLK